MEDKLKLLTKKQLYTDDHINFTKLKQYLAQERKIDQAILNQLINRFHYIIKNEPSLLKVDEPVTIIGDIHGQYYDLLKILNLVKQYEENQKNAILFLGDYVDRGVNSVQVIILLMYMKVQSPNSIYLLRGNHESKVMTSFYNFKKECIQKYSQQIYSRIIDCFEGLPLACIVKNQYFCVHGGVSLKLKDLKQINKINRFQQIPSQGIFCDLLWADPTNHQEGYVQGHQSLNTDRGCSVFFGRKAVNKFLSTNNFATIIRAHQVFYDGFRRHFWNGKDKVPSIITIFSAPNYCNSMGNLAAILHINQGHIDIRQYREDTIKNKLTQVLEIFKWSLPQLLDITNDFAINMIDKICNLYVPELKDKSYKIKILAFIKYFKNLRIKNHFQFIEKNQAYLAQENQKQHLFNRSQQYYSHEYNQAIKDEHSFNEKNIKINNENNFQIKK